MNSLNPTTQCRSTSARAWSRRLLYLCTALAAGCGMPGLVWDDTVFGHSEPGALNAGNQRPPMLSRCGTPGFMGERPNCAYAFVDSVRAKVDIFDLRDRLDAALEALPQTKPWINRVGSTKKELELPWRLHLLTVSPAVLLVVPLKPREYFRDCGSVLVHGCFQSYSFTGRGYWFRGDPPIAEGSFWFSLDAPGTVHAVDAQAGSVSIASGAALLRLQAAGGNWSVSRER